MRASALDPLASEPAPRSRKLTPEELARAEPPWFLRRSSAGGIAAMAAGGLLLAIAVVVTLTHGWEVTAPPPIIRAEPGAIKLPPPVEMPERLLLSTPATTFPPLPRMRPKI